MGMSYSTYFAYGVHVPGGDPEHCEEVLFRLKQECPDVRYLSAGAYDRDELFLTTQCTEVDLGKWVHVTPQSYAAELLSEWDWQLATALRELGYDDRGVSAPGWLCVPDMS